MDRAEVSSSNNGNAQRTIFGQNLLVNRNKVNTNTFDKLLTDLEAKVNLVNGEIKQINRQFSTLNGINFSFIHFQFDENWSGFVESSDKVYLSSNLTF